MTNTATTEKKNTMKKFYPAFKGITFALFVLSVFWALFGVCRGFAIVAAFLLGFLFFLSLNRNKENTTDIFTSCLMIADVSFIVGVMFLLGRAFMGM